MGRPRKPIDWKVFDALCKAQCTLAEIASQFDMSEDTIQRAVKREKKMRFADYYGQKAKAGPIAIRRKQLQLALNGKGDRAMLIWLGKQWLGQKEPSNDAPGGSAPSADALEVARQVRDAVREMIAADGITEGE